MMAQTALRQAGLRRRLPQPLAFPRVTAGDSTRGSLCQECFLHAYLRDSQRGLTEWLDSLGKGPTSTLFFSILYSQVPQMPTPCNSPADLKMTYSFWALD